MQNEETMLCSECGCVLTEADEHYQMEEETLCVNCYYEETISCSCCGARIWGNDNMGDSETPLCQDCYDEHYTHCESCDRLLHDEDNEGDSNNPVCSHCYGYHYTHCDRCNRLITNEHAYYTDDDNEDGPYCYDCYQRQENHTHLHTYNYKPEPIFHGEGYRYLGVELEIDDGGKDNYNAEKLCNIANRNNDNIYIKTDGSLEDGLEIVTHPMTIDYHLKSMPWRALLKEALELGYRSHMADTCGLHIHVNRNSFSDDYDRQEECIGRVLYFVERFWEELLRFSRRTEAQLKRWANRYGYKAQPSEILDTAKKGYGGRYTCVNITNYATIEFRIFRGTLKHNSLIAALELVNEICNVAFNVSNEELASLSWCGFMERLSKEQYPELIEYLKERRLYINEPVLCEEEV